MIKANLSASNNTWKFVDGSIRSRIELESASIGLGQYNPGWKWSLHAGVQTGANSQKHVGYVISGAMMIQDTTGHKVKVGPGDAFEVGPGHDAWVIGSEPCVALDFNPILDHR